MKIYASAMVARLVILMGFVFVTANAWSQVQGHHTTNPFGYNLFIDPTTRMPNICTPQNGQSLKDCETALEQEAIAYYRAIGVFQPIGGNDPSHLPPGTADRGTFTAWKTTLGFSQDPNAPASGETRGTYFNNGDLQFGRDMHCRAQTNTRQSGPLKVVESITYACYVSNYTTDPHNLPGPTADPVGSVNLAVAPNPHPVATVVMEVTATPRFVPLPKPPAKPPHGSRVQAAFTTTMKYGDVRFFAYKGDNTPVVAAQLDSEGNKALPGLCLACHGGSYQSSQSGTARIVAGNFLPFDTSSFLYGTAGNLTEATQDESFRLLNRFVKSTQPVRQTIADLIDGWYQWCGGVDHSQCYIDETSHPFIPGDPSSCASKSTTCTADCAGGASDPKKGNYSCGWATGKPLTSAPFDIRAFYTQVVAKECRTCHVALSDTFNVENYAEWLASAGTIGNDVFGIDKMPFGQVPFVDFWSGKAGTNGESARDFMKAFYGCPSFIPPIATGDGTDIVIIQVVPNTVAIDQVGLSLTVTNSHPTWWKAVNVAGFETFTQDAKQSSSITIPVGVVSAVPVMVLKKAKFAGLHNTVQTLTLPTAPFTYGGCTISLNWAAD
jgi:hypothetical protein